MSSTNNKIEEALKLCKEEKFSDAEIILEKIKKDFTGDIFFLNLIGTLKIQLGKIEEGINFLEISLKKKSHQPKTLINLGLAYQYIDNKDKSLYFYSIAAKKIKNSPELFNNRGVLYRDLGKNNMALKDFDTAISLKKNYFEAIFNKGLTLSYMYQFELAKICYIEVIRYLPNHLDALISLGLAEKQLRNYKEALKYFKTAQSLNLNLVDINFYLIEVLVLNNHYDEAWKILHNLEANNTKDHRISFYKSILNLKLSNLIQAEKEINLALKLNVNFIEGICHKALILEKLSRCEDAIELCRKTNIANNYLINNTLGFLYFQLGNIKAAENYFKQTLSLQPNFSEAAYSLALIYLAQKKFKKGWDLYKNRSSHQNSKLHNKKLLPELLPENFNSFKSPILVVKEQGIGDQILYSSLFKEFNKIFPNLVINVDKRLINIYKRSFLNIKFVDDDCLFSETYDFYLHMGDIPRYLRLLKSDFKNQEKSFLISNKKKSYNFRLKLKKNEKLICGVAWKSLNKDFEHSKNIQLEFFAPIFKNSNICFVNLQYGENENEIKKLEQQGATNLIAFDDIDMFNDLESVFALVDSCDFIITCSNAIAHIAGSLGKKTYLLVPFSSGLLWYWHLHDKKSIWYPSVKIFRQKDSKIWSDTIIEVAESIKLEYE